MNRFYNQVMKIKLMNIYSDNHNKVILVVIYNTKTQFSGHISVGQRSDYDEISIYSSALTALEKNTQKTLILLKISFSFNSQIYCNFALQ